MPLLASTTATLLGVIAPASDNFATGLGAPGTASY